MEFGLGKRLQLDIYLMTEQVGQGPLRLAAEKLELRYALADWGAIPLNPTLYAELVRQDYEVLAGPSLFVSPTDPMRILLVALFGSEVEGDSSVPLFQSTVIVGWEI